jgi:hypothetical protein
MEVSVSFSDTRCVNALIPIPLCVDQSREAASSGACRLPVSREWHPSQHACQTLKRLGGAGQVPADSCGSSGLCHVNTEQFDVALAGAWFESRSGHRLYCIRSFATYLSPSRKMLEYCLH